MSFEIERKFLVLSDTWQKSATRHAKIRQAYLDSTAKISIRVRIKDDSSATLTLKSRSSKLRRREFEYAIPTLDAEELISLRRSYIIEKVRHTSAVRNSTETGATCAAAGFTSTRLSGTQHSNAIAAMRARI
jgi:CYTH domain-containing protein